MESHFCKILYEQSERRSNHLMTVQYRLEQHNPCFIIRLECMFARFISAANLGDFQPCLERLTLKSHLNITEDPLHSLQYQGYRY